LIYTSLREHGKVVRGWLGVSIRSVSDQPDLAKSFGYQGDSGVMVEQTFPNTPASGKLLDGDIITEVNGQPVSDVTELRNLIAQTPPNTAVKLHLFRDQKEMDVQITLGDQPENLAALIGGNDQGDNGAAPNDQAQAPVAMGMTFKTLDADTAQSLGLNDVRSGAVITAVERNSAAAQAGLQEGDVITEVGRTPVHTADEAVDALKKVDLSKGVRLYIATKAGSEFVFLQQDQPSQ
jgi:serine protease Do